MASKDIIEGGQNVLTCSVCQNQLTDPVVANCGHCFCQSCLSEASMPLSCHRCMEISQSTFHAILRRRGKLPKKRKPSVTPQQSQQRPEGPGKCDKHQENKKLFCMYDQSLLCASCSQSQKHEDHTIQPIEEAAKLYRKKLQENLKAVNGNLQDIQKIMLEEKKIPRTWAVVWTEQVEMSRETFEEKFQEISDFLSDEEEEVHSLVELDEEENKMFQWLKEQEAEQEICNREKKRMSHLQLSQHRNDLREMATTLKEKSQMPDTALLQDAEDTLNESESLLLQTPKPFTPKLSSSYCMVLREFLRKFQESRLLQCRYPYELPDDDRKRTFTFADISSGRMYAIYTSGSLHYMNGRDLSITQLNMDGYPEEEEDYPISTCYCLPIEREYSHSDFSPSPSMEWH
ncbi:tripartite motif-containing protein 43-like [Trichosurus vulpecula]|uniref:tripartite motif-containing protein 43-like n=1 Tax=Trichosurus vulpecula TaxID=9337 RepID=UPI00186AF061|nr:tripartite motif-containing protein 43-like [Trichosurus vulpecula]